MSQVTVIVCDNANCKFTLGHRNDSIIHRVNWPADDIMFSVKMHNNILTVSKLEREWEIMQGGAFIIYKKHILTGVVTENIVRLVRTSSENTLKGTMYSYNPLALNWANAWLQFTMFELKTVPLRELAQRATVKAMDISNQLLQ